MRRPIKIPRLPRPKLSFTAILRWADDHRRQRGKYPIAHAGPVLCADAPLGMTWWKIDIALRRGNFGLPGDSSLARLLEKHRGVRNRSNLPRLTDEIILAWADRHHRRTGKWPNENTGPVAATNGEHWANINAALRVGIRGLEGKRTLARLLAKRRHVRNRSAIPKLSIGKILKMADAHRELKGQWPKVGDGLIAGFDGETWLAVNTALDKGRRGLQGGSSLAQLLQLHRGRNGSGAKSLPGFR